MAKNWHTRIPDVRNKISHAINDMPSHEELIKLLSGTRKNIRFCEDFLTESQLTKFLCLITDIHYYHCLRIIEILKTTEADTKSVFGRYGSQRMKDWQEIVRLYERDSIYLGEAAQILVRNINYELPSVKKQIAKFDQLIDEAQKKIQDQTASEAVLLSQRTALCQKLGIKGENLHNEFLDKIKELPKFYADIAGVTGKLKIALELYGKISKNADCLPMLRHVVKKGNSTVYEYVHGEAPLSVEEPPIQIKLTVDGSANAADGDNTVSFIVFYLSMRK